MIAVLLALMVLSAAHVDNKTLFHAPAVCDACNAVASAVVTHRGRIVSVDAVTTRVRGGLFHADCHGRFVLEQEVTADAS